MKREGGEGREKKEGEGGGNIPKPCRLLTQSFYWWHECQNWCPLKDHHIDYIQREVEKHMGKRHKGEMDRSGRGAGAGRGRRGGTRIRSLNIQSLLVQQRPEYRSVILQHNKVKKEDRKEQRKGAGNVPKE